MPCYVRLIVRFPLRGQETIYLGHLVYDIHIPVADTVFNEPSFLPEQVLGLNSRTAVGKNTDEL